MTNYPYIIASLPELQTDFEAPGFDYPKTLDFIRSQCSARDCRYIDWLDAGFDDVNIGHYFYAKVAKSRCAFLRKYFEFDHRVRQAKVAFLEGKEYDPLEVPDGEALMDVFTTANLIERERKLDLLYWLKADEMVQFSLFDIDVILSFIVKARIADRWRKLDPATGAEFFKQLVQEVRGTFKGVEYDPDKK